MHLARSFDRQWLAKARDSHIPFHSRPLFWKGRVEWCSPPPPLRSKLKALLFRDGPLMLEVTWLCSWTDLIAPSSPFLPLLVSFAKSYVVNSSEESPALCPLMALANKWKHQTKTMIMKQKGRGHWFISSQLGERPENGTVVIRHFRSASPSSPHLSGP